MKVKHETHHWIPRAMSWFMGYRIEAVTWGSTIYWRGGITGLLAHELIHVEQFKRHGKLGFLFKYLSDYRKNRKAGMSKREAYLNIPFEVEARERSR